jgi:superfamily II DNA or RNA helicase
MATQIKPRRRPSKALRARLYQRSRGVCENAGCDTPIGFDSFQVSHLRSHASGGALVMSNLAAWCAPCNQANGSRDVADTRMTPRAWQSEALAVIVPRIVETGVATVAAAPGAGKTVFAGLVFEELRGRGLVDRMVVLVPRRALADQWRIALRAARHIELLADGIVESARHDGVVTTYQSLTIDAVDVHQEQAARGRTLLVLDEVHHVGEGADGDRASWARAVAELAGDVGQLNVAGVLNLSGTPWRSAHGERISTVRYDKTGDHLRPQIDYQVSSRDLIAQKQLRPVSLFRLDAEVAISDRSTGERIDGPMCELDTEPARAALAALARFDRWRSTFVSAVLDKLEAAQTHVPHAKALIVANRQDDARAFQAEVHRQMAARGLRPLVRIAISDEDSSSRTLDEFRHIRRSGVLCTVGMAGEGYDCPDIAVIGYATNRLTALFVHQVAARAMRVTNVERERGIVPAAVVIPDVAELVVLMHDLLEPLTPVVAIDGVPEDDGGAPIHTGGQEWIPRYEVQRMDVGELDSGFRIDVIRDAAAKLEQHGIPGEHAELLLRAEQLSGVDFALFND